MAYSTKADLLNRLSQQELIELTTDDPDATQEDDNVINQAITDADEEIESYVAKRYHVPLSPVPGRINTLSVDITLYNLHTRQSQTFDPNEKSTAQARYKSAVKFLQDVAAGKVTLGELPEPTKSELLKGTVQKNDRKFTRETMEGF